MQSFLKIASILILLAFLTSTTWGDEPKLPSEQRKLVVGTKHSPPFAFKNADGKWKGLSIELWRQLADELDLKFELREMTLDEMLAGLESGELDAAVAAISVTAERNQRIEFCHPHYTTGLGMAVSNNRPVSNWTLLRRVVSTRLLIIVGILVGIVLGCGLLFWFFERKQNESTFGSGRRQGIAMGIWWSMILLLGHKGLVPASNWSRVLAACAMITSILLFSLLTGVIASVLTVQQLDTGIEDPSDLRHVRVVTVQSSTSAEYLTHRRIVFRTRPTAEAALQAVVDGKADALVYDEALLKYLVKSEFAETVQVLPKSFNTQDYAIGLPPESPLRKPLNTALLRFRASDLWDDLTYRYLGNE